MGAPVVAALTALTLLLVAPFFVFVAEWHAWALFAVYGLFFDYAQSALDRQQVPITLKDFVRDYFSRLEPTE